MPKGIDVVDQKPKSEVRDEKSKNLSVIDEKPKSFIDDSAIEGYETVNSVFLVGHYMGIPVLTYTVAGTVTFVQPKGGRAG